MVLSQSLTSGVDTATNRGQAAKLGIIGNSPAMQELFKQLEPAGRTGATVLIEGETGVGKSLIASALHRLSPRARRPFVRLGAPNIPEELFESELFGHVKGAFSGAFDHHKGLARAADGGTLFIDEVAELTPANQAKLLCFLDQQEVRPVGGVRAYEVDVRVVCATNRGLREEIEQGTFRRDLYYRLRVISLRVPNLRERLEDLPSLAAHFLSKLNQKYGKRVAGLSPAALAKLRAHPWEGNVRELENEIERAVVLTADGAEIAAEDLALEVPRIPLAASSLQASREAAERQTIAHILERYRWNVSASARELGISRVGLTRKLKRLGIHRPSSEPRLAECTNV